MGMQVSNTNQLRTSNCNKNDNRMTIRRDKSLILHHNSFLSPTTTKENLAVTSNELHRKETPNELHRNPWSLERNQDPMLQSPLPPFFNSFNFYILFAHRYNEPLKLCA